jgi:putative nucleotidyltransferase with HDIG domain
MYALSNEISEARLSRRQAALAILIAAITATLLAVVIAARLTILTSLSPADASFVQGQASPVNVLAPDRITFVSPLETTRAQEQAATSVTDVYDPPDGEVARGQVRLASRMLDYLDTVRADPYSTRGEKIDWVTAVPTITLSSEVVSRTLALDDTTYNQVISETLYVLDQAMRDEIREGALEGAYTKLPSRVSLVLSPEQADLVTEWAKSFLAPNSYYNAAKTNAARQAARDSVGVVYRTIESGQAVVRAGEVITPETFEALRELGYLQPQDNYQETVAAVIFSAFLIVISALYLARFAPHTFREPRVLLLLSFLLIGTALGTKIIVPGRSVIPYLFPFAAAGMLSAAVLDAEVGIGVAMIVALAVGYLANGALELTIFALVGGMVAVLTLRQRDRVTAFVISGTYVALANAAVVLIFAIPGRNDDLANLTRQTLAAAGSGALTGLIALGSQFILGKMAGVTTGLELVELSRPTHPLLQKLLREAPGTYHHSLIISNLAEQAAQRIGADALLLRVGAYYHDVGKTMNPQFYVENQFDGVNPHDNLEPRASAAILFQHVLDGLALTKRYGVSKRVRDLIPQHHGTTLSAYFYDKALKQANGDLVDIDAFRYPGPKPQTREAAIIMLADGVEATARADRPTSPEQIHAIIDRIVDQRIHERQLEDAPITFRDLDQIKQAFFDVLQGLYHPRLRYPVPSYLKRKEEPVFTEVAAGEKTDGN